MAQKEGKQLPQIVVVGGGAGGLELATRLGETLGKRGQARIVLVDAMRTHIWKPLLHEVAAGTLDSHEHELEYLAQATYKHFRFILGRMDGLDRESRCIHLAPLLNDRGEEIIPARTLPYDKLVIAIGSLSNDFGIPGVREHCLFLDTTKQAEEFQARMMEAYIRAHTQGYRDGKLNIAIVGGGATGIELSAQLNEVSQLLSTYGLDEVSPADVRITIIEAADRLLPELPERLSNSTRAQLESLGVTVETGERVLRVTPEGMHTASGRVIQADIRVWAAGIKAPDCLKDLAGLETNKINQLVVRQTLQTTHDDRIYAIGDCAACPWPEHNRWVPPRAQAAHQQAELVYENLCRELIGKPLRDYRYHDYGSLVSLGEYSTVGNLMGNLLGSVMIEGLLARLVYLSLYKMHQLALFGMFRVGMLMLSHLFRRSVKPKIKLH